MAKKKTGRGIPSTGHGTGKFKKADTGRQGRDKKDTGTFSPRASGWRSSKGRSTGKMRSVSGRRTTGKVRAVRRTSGHELVPVICSECFEEFAFDTGVKTDTLVCPVCEHSANRPDDQTLRRISALAAAERTNFMISFILTGVALAAFGAWVFLMKNPANAAEGAKFWGPIGVAGLAALVLVVFIVKYEGNRWEAYF